MKGSCCLNQYIGVRPGYFILPSLQLPRKNTIHFSRYLKRSPCIESTSPDHTIVSRCSPPSGESQRRVPGCADGESSHPRGENVYPGIHNCPVLLTASWVRVSIRGVGARDAASARGCRTGPRGAVGLEEPTEEIETAVCQVAAIHLGVCFY